MISLVMLNWARPDGVRHLASVYLRYRLIDELFIFNNSGKALNIEPAAGLVVIEASRDLGLFTRFAGASLARNRAILHVDDDLSVPESTVEQLYHHWQERPQLCHALHGRRVGGRYDPETVWGPVEVVLTRCVLVDRLICATCLTVAHHFDDLPCEPRGNGEDIVMSFVAMSLSRRLNHAYRLPYEEHPSATSTESIYRRWKAHYSHRHKVVERCRAVFQLPPDRSGQT